MTKTRCTWADLSKPDYVSYHDDEWGVPVHDENKHLEMLILEGAQAGLSWYTILKRRDEYRKCFHNFVPEKLANMNDTELNALVKDSAIIKNRAKIFSARQNAKVFLKIQQEFGSFDRYIWQFVGGKTIVNQPKDLKSIPATSEISDKISKDLKKRGMNFVGKTIIYAYMQACGLVDDHIVSCYCKN